MKQLNLIDISCIGNGVGSLAYGGKLMAYSFTNADQYQWINTFVSRINKSIATKTFLPIIRIADGELALLFPLLLLQKSSSLKKICSNIKLLLLSATLIEFETSWGEKYSPSNQLKFRLGYSRILKYFSKCGILAIYWNENGLDAFTSHNSRLLSRFSSMSIVIDETNYYPFHFPLALLLNPSINFTLKDLKVLFVSSLDEDEKEVVVSRISTLGASHVDFYDIPKKLAHTTICAPQKAYDIIFVSAGIASISIIYQLRHMKCPCIDIGGTIHLISCKQEHYHGKFFVSSILPYNEK